MEWIEAGSLSPNPNNWRRHPEHQAAALRESIDDVGWAGALLFNKTSGRLIDGHARRDGAEATELVPVLVGEWTPTQERRILATLDPITALAEPDPVALGKLLDGLTFDGEALAKLGQDLALDIVLAGDPEPPEPTQVIDPEIPETPKKPVTKRGDLWALGDHFLVCGDCTNEEPWAKLMAGADAKDSILLADPPYCSGGYQEAGRHVGSVGRQSSSARVANDTLSTRGYTALIKSALCYYLGGVVYLFTDWRQWVNLFDTVESSGFGVRAMIVWNKLSPGMGRGWRPQHELVICGTRTTEPFDMKAGVGNVISMKRIPHKHHATEKPVALLACIMGVSKNRRLVVDPFAGSGSVLLAAQQLGRPSRSMELEPGYCDVIIERWAAMTGGKAKRVKR